MGIARRGGGSEWTEEEVGSFAWGEARAQGSVEVSMGRREGRRLVTCVAVERARLRASKGKGSSFEKLAAAIEIAEGGMEEGGKWLAKA